VNIVVFAWGNPSRGDDAVGPWFAEWLRDRAFPEVTVIEDFQLQVEHILDCQGGDLLLFIDACCRQAPGATFAAVEPVSELAHTSHALSPAQLLGYYPRVIKAQPPPAFQLAVAGMSFELGDAMSARCEASCRSTAVFLETLLHQADANSWQSLSGPVVESRCA
jgi:hydrogenase maturation protease